VVESRSRTAEADRQIILPDGRRLGHAVFGDPDGFPVFYLHGFPASRLEALLYDAAARRAGAMLVAVDRPGFGLSDFQPTRRIGDWPDDVRCLADALGIDRFSLIGGSGGGPYALACASRMAERLHRVATVGGLGPVSESGLSGTMSPTARLGFELARRHPFLFRLAYGALGRAVARFPPLIFQLNEAAPRDQSILATPELRGILMCSTREAFRQGTAGAVRELRLFARPWDLALEAIAVRLDIWHGGQDRIVPPAMAEWLARKVPGAKLHLLPQEAHLSIALCHADDILLPLLPTAAKSDG
jgi:pimeloyl-ACP methyl ester carboxylesterase